MAHSIQIHKLIGLLTAFLYLIGVWHRGDKPTVKEIRLKLSYCIYYLLFPISLMVGAINNEKMEKKIFLTEILIGTVVALIKTSFLIWKQNQICYLANRVCVFSIQNDDDYALFNNKLKGFAKFALVYVIFVIFASFFETAVIPLISSEKTLFLEIGFVLDWKDSEIAFWIATAFVSIQIFISMFTSIFSIVLWYLLFMCSLRYDVLGRELSNMGRIRTKRIGNTVERHTDFLEELKTSINTHLHLKEMTNELGSCFSDIFFILFGSSGLCICGSIYCLAFDIGGNSVERVMFLMIFLYFISEIFMITYLGNEIMLSSNRLTYCLFESDWIEQPQSTKKCLIVFGEYLKKPQTLMVGKLYPLTLETFTRILNSAYNMFNILQNFRK